VSAPLVSVVTPFHNTASHLRQCIESVLTQTYSHFEYVLSDNCSTDRSSEIAESYARCDRRIRLVRQPRLLSQVEHYNQALSEISQTSEYCKIVQADDFIFPECLQRMVSAFEQSETIGLVSSYDLKGAVVRGSGFPYPVTFLPGQEMAKLCLRTGLFVFGSPTTVMYRSSMVRQEQPFYDQQLLHEDTEKCMQILKHWDFGFVHQVLSFLRVDDESISGSSRSFHPDALDRYILVQRYAPMFLETEESILRRRQNKRDYYRMCARAAIQRREAAFWSYHKDGLGRLGETIDWRYLAIQIIRELIRLAVNPGPSTMTTQRTVKQRTIVKDTTTKAPSICDQAEDRSHVVPV
jgi:glycosyltransferase involved in cell wall biosynthesis